MARGTLLIAALAAAATAYNNGFLPVSSTPPLGWSTWCTDDACGLLDLCFEEEIHQIADAMQAQGMVAAGYKLILLDDCWSATTRDAAGNLQPDPARFPSGIPALVEYVEARGLYLGIYTCAGTQTCKYGRPGSWGHYEQDATTLTGWGVKWIKADNCHTENQGLPRQYYANFSAAINATGVPVAFHSCEWGEDEVWTWGANVTQVFRINQDHLPFWHFNTSNGPQGTADIIEVMANRAISGSSVPFGWADADFLMTGLPTFTHTESETEFAMWALWNGPMVIASDVRNMSAWMASVVLNADILAVNQDPAAIPGYRVRADAGQGTQVWIKPLGNGDVAAVLYNSNDTTAFDIPVQWQELGWPAGADVRVYDLWAHAVVANATGGWTAVQVPPHGSSMLRLTLLPSAAGQAPVAAAAKPLGAAGRGSGSGHGKRKAAK